MKSIKKIACVGWHDTGSSVIDDLLRECDNVAQGVSGAELRILHDPDGISDLEYHLIRDPHRLGTSLAIRRFIDYCERHARMERKLVGKDWDVMFREYVQSLVTITYKGWLETDIMFFPLWKKKWYWCIRAFNYLMPKPLKKQRWYNFFPNEETYYARPTEELFLVETSRFINNICTKMNIEQKEFLVLDQFTSAHNPMNAIRYTDNLKIIIVDRDPRDLYIHDVKMYKEHILAPQALDFAKQYRLIRKETYKDDPALVLRVNYEDLIYKYDETLLKIFDFLGIDPKKHHKYPKRFFNPVISINGTLLWKRFPQYMEEVRIIEEELPDMLYPYPPNVDELYGQITADNNLKDMFYVYEHMDDL